MKKLFAMLVVGGILAASVVGCGPAATTGDNKPNPSPTPPSHVTPPVEMTTMGKVSKIDKKAVTVKDDKDKEMIAMVGADTKITLDGKDAKIDDLKEGQSVTVKSKGDAVTSIDAKGAAAPPPPPPPPPADKPVSGKVTKVDGSKVTMSVDGKDKEITIPDGAKVTIDGKDAKAADIKAADATTATVTMDKDGKVTTVEVKTK